VVHLIAERAYDRSADLGRLSEDQGTPGTAFAEELISPRHLPGMQHPREVRVLPKSRDFH
jgi:error-prone DNA polymerase